MRLVAKAESLQLVRDVFGDMIPLLKSVELKLEREGDRAPPLLTKRNAAAGKSRLKAQLKLQREPPRPRPTG